MNTKQEAIRKQRIKQVAETILKRLQDGPLNEKAFITIGSYNLGVSMKTMKEYVEIAKTLTNTKTEGEFIIVI